MPSGRLTWPSGRRAGGAALLALLLAAAAPGGASDPARPGPTSFWDRYVLLRDLLEMRPDSARAVADSLVRADAHDFLGRWLAGGCLAAKDTARAREALELAVGDPRGAGGQVEAGAIHFAWKETSAGRAAFDRAREAYLAAGRAADAARASLWKLLDSSERGDRVTLEADAAEAESLARRTGEPAAVADVLILKGVAAVRRDAGAARRAFREALALLAPLGAGGQLVASHRSLGFVLNQAGEFDSAAARYGAAVELARSLPDTAQEVSALCGLGNVRKARGAYAEAAEVVSRAVAMAEAFGRPRVLADAYYAQGTLLAEMGRHGAARDRYARCLGIMEKARWEPDLKVSALDALGVVEVALGDYETARTHLEQALALARQRGLKTTLCFVLLHLSDLHRELGDLDEARSRVEEGLEAAREVGQRRVESVLLSEKAQILYAMRDDDGALRAAREGKRLAARVEPRNLWRLSLDEARALSRLGRGGEGIAVLESTLARFPQMPDSSHLQRVLVLEGAIHLRAREVEKAIAIFTRALGIARSLGHPGREASAQLSLGQALLAAGRPREAVAALEPGLQWFETVQSAVRASEERSAYQERWHEGYVTLARAYARSGEPSRAFATFERSRARELRRLFRLRPAPVRGKVPRSLAGQVEQAESRLSALQTALFHAYGQPPARRPPDLASMEREVDSLRRVWERLNRRVQREAPAYAREVGLLPALSSAEVRRSLGPGERLVAFMVGGDATLLFDLHPERGPRVHELPCGEDSLARMVEGLLALLREAGSRGGASRAAGLGELLLGRCRLSDDPPRVLYVLPDGALHYVPFEALPLGAGRGAAGRYLVEGSDVVYATSATLLFNPPSSRRAEAAAGYAASLVAFGDPAVGGGAGPAQAPAAERGSLPTLGPLPHARREVLALPALFPRARVYVGERATEERFFAEAGRAPIVHVAAHAFADDHHPEFSGIVLAAAPSRGGGGRREDGLVQAFEVMERSYNLELATLSACETGRGPLQRGEGLIGLARAFRLAGARNLVVSLWKVDDAATADFMAEFYQRLSGGEAVPAALRGAKLACLGAGAAPGGKPSAPAASRGVGKHKRPQSLADPSVWAAFVLHGSRSR